MHGAIQKGYIYTIQIANEWTEMVEIVHLLAIFKQYT